MEPRDLSFHNLLPVHEWVTCLPGVGGLETYLQTGPAFLESRQSSSLAPNEVSKERHGCGSLEAQVH